MSQSQDQLVAITNDCRRLTIELGKLQELVNLYEKKLAAGKDLSAKQAEEIRSLRRGISDGLETARIREQYVIDLQGDHTRIQEWGEGLQRRLHRLAKELEFMTARVDTLEKDLNKAMDTQFITNSVYYNSLSEDILQWKRLRDMMLSTDPEKTFWDTVHTYSMFMEKTLKLSYEGDRISNEHLRKTKHFWSREIFRQLEAMGGEYNSLTKLMDLRLPSMNDIYQRSSHNGTDSDSDPDSSVDDIDSDFRSFFSPGSSPYSQSMEFRDVATFIKKSRTPKDLDEEMDEDDDDVSTIENMCASIVHRPTGQPSRYMISSNTGTQRRETEMVQDRELAAGHTTPIQASDSQNKHQGFKFRQLSPDETFISQGGVDLQSFKASRKRSKQRNSAFHAKSNEIRSTRSGSSGSPYTRPIGMNLRSPVVHRYLGGEDCLKDDPVHVQRRRVRGYFPQRVSKEYRTWSPRSSRQSSPSLSTISEEELARMLASARTRGARSQPVESHSYDLWQWIWIYVKQRPGELIGPMMGAAVLLAILYIFRDWRHYSRVVAANTAADRMMYRMRQAQSEFTFVDHPLYQQWKQWLDADRVALQ